MFVIFRLLSVIIDFKSEKIQNPFEFTCSFMAHSCLFQNFISNVCLLIIIFEIDLEKTSFWCVIVCKTFTHINFAFIFRARQKCPYRVKMSMTFFKFEHFCINVRKCVTHDYTPK